MEQLETKADWIKEARYLYKLLKERHELGITEQLSSFESMSPEHRNEIIESTWKVWCIEKNIDPKEYGFE